MLYIDRNLQIAKYKLNTLKVAFLEIILRFLSAHYHYINGTQNINLNAMSKYSTAWTIFFIRLTRGGFFWNTSIVLTRI